VIEDPKLAKARLDIDLPNTELGGAVLDKNGRSIAGAMILLVGYSGNERPSFLKSDEEGRFIFSGLAPGLYRLEAHKVDAERRRWSSEPIEVTIDPESPVEDLDLLLYPPRRLSGYISSFSGPVAGAKIDAILKKDGGELGLLFSKAASDEKGHFELDLPAGESFVLTVSAPGFALHRRLLRPKFGRQLSILLDQLMGTLDLHLEREYVPGEREHWPPTITLNGEILFSLSDLERWAQRNGIENRTLAISIPNMPAGEYEVCWQMPQANSSETSTQQCAHGALPPNGRLSLERAPHGAN
jgi:hypothetical protein